LIILMSAISGIVILLIVVGALRRRGSMHEHEPWYTGGGKLWILIGGLVVPFVVLSAVFIVTLATLGAFPHGKESGEVTIHVMGHQWWWQVTYLDPETHGTIVTANEIHVPVGIPTAIRLTTSDVIHSFWVPRLHGKLDLIPGRVNEIRITAVEPGSYYGECAEYCGLQHSRMKFLVVAEEPAEFKKWLTLQRAPAGPPVNALAAEGQKVFMERACAFCHTIRGVNVGGGVAPDLTHVGSRRILAANFPNTQAILEAWIVNAQSLKPGTLMPSVNDFTGQELRALSAYLQSLR
jgi:cytochrome c oxidase subunit 2